MRISILTLPLDRNYGGILQCYALQTVLRHMGHEVKILSKPKYGYSYCVIYPLSIFKRLLKRFLLRYNVSIFKPSHEIVSANIDIFVNRYFTKYTKRHWNSSISKQFDAVIVGSDQIWRPQYSESIEHSFLSFLDGKNIKRISYAASFGVDECEYNEEQIKKCSSLLRQFDAVSVREASGIDICRNYLGVDAVQMLDPTLLLNVDDYCRLIDNTDTCPIEGSMLVYILDDTEEKRYLIETVAKERGLIPFYINIDTEDSTIPLENRIKIPVEQWLRSFRDASFVFTDSFHGCVFSIIFRKEFIAIGNKARGLSRFHSLLNQFSIDGRLILSKEEYENNRALLTEEIDYNKVCDKLNYERNRSYEFIENSLLE